MANRLILGAPGGVIQFKLSRPGQNVLTASGSNLIWDVTEAGVAAGGFLGIYARGTQSKVVGAGIDTISDTVAFGKTFATPPTVFCLIEFPSGNVFRPFSQYVIYGPLEKEWFYFIYTVTTTGIAWSVSHIRDNNAGVRIENLPVGTYTLHYTICQS